MNMLKRYRKESQFTLEHLSEITAIDKSVLSKYESGKRIPTDRHITLLANRLGAEYNELNCYFQAEKIANMLKYEPLAKEILSVAESRIAYLSSSKASVKVQSVPTEVEARLSVVDSLMKKWQLVKPLDGTQLHKLKE